MVNLAEIGKTKIVVRPDLEMNIHLGGEVEQVKLQSINKMDVHEGPGKLIPHAFINVQLSDGSTPTLELPIKGTSKEGLIEVDKNQLETSIKNILAGKRKKL